MKIPKLVNESGEGSEREDGFINMKFSNKMAAKKRYSSIYAKMEKPPDVNSEILSPRISTDSPAGMPRIEEDNFSYSSLNKVI